MREAISIDTNNPGVKAFKAEIMSVGADVDRTWADITSKEKLVYALHQYRAFRSRQLLNVGTPQEAMVLARLEPWVRGKDLQRPMKYVRFPCKMAAILTTSTYGIRLAQVVELVDISATGARVKLAEGIEVAETVKLSISRRILGEGVLEWSALVVWVKNGHAGIHFSGQVNVEATS